MLRHAEKHRARNLRNYRAKKGLPVDREEERITTCFERLMADWPTTLGIPRAVAHGRQALASWRSGLTMKDFGDNLCQLRFCFDDLPAPIHFMEDALVSQEKKMAAACFAWLR